MLRTRRTLGAWLAVALMFLIGLLATASAAALPRQASLDDRLSDGDLDRDDLLSTAAVRGNPVMPSPRGHAWLSVVGVSRTSALGAREYGGFLVLGLPLDRFVPAPGPPSGRTRLAQGAATGSAQTASAGGPLREPPAREPPHVQRSEAPTHERPPVTKASIVELEPSLVLTPKLARAVVGQALATAGLGVDDARLDSVASRARWSALLPELRLRAVQYDDQRLYTDTTTTSDDSRLRDSAAAQLSLEGRLTWRLDRLVYADDEPAFERMRLDRQEARAKIAHRALEALFRWQKAWLELHMAAREQGRSPPEEAALALKVIEAEAELDVLTGGWFSRWNGAKVDVLVPPSPATPPPEGPSVERGDPDPPRAESASSAPKGTSGNGRGNGKGRGHASPATIPASL